MSGVQPEVERGPETVPSASSGRVGRRALLTTTSLIVAQLCSIPLAFTAVKVITNGVGATNYGIYATCFSFTGVFALLADFGVNSITAREVAKDPERAGEIVPLSIGLRLALSLVVAPLILLASFAVYPDAAGVLHIGVALVAITFVPDVIRTVLFGYLTGRARNHWVAVATVLQQALFLVCTVLAVVLAHGLIGIFVGYLLASSLTTVAVVLAVRRSVRVRPRVSLVAWRRLFVMASSVGTIQVVNLFYLRADGLLLSVLVGPVAVGLYVIAYSVINGTTVIPGFFMSSLLPEIVSSDQQGRQVLLKRALDVLAVLGALLVALLLLAAPAMVTIISSPASSGAAVPLMLLGVATFFTFVNATFGYSSVALNVHQRIVWISIGGLVLNLVLNLLLIPRGGVAGAATATLVCEALVFVATYVSFVRRTELRVPLVPSFVRAGLIIGAALLLARLSQSTEADLPAIASFFLSALEALFAGGVVLGAEWLLRKVLRRSGRAASPIDQTTHVRVLPSRRSIS